MKRPFLVTQLAVLFEEGTAQHRLRRQPLPASFREPLSAQIGGHQLQKIAMAIEPLRHRLQLTTDLVLDERSNMLPWTACSWRNVGSGGCGFCQLVA